MSQPAPALRELAEGLVTFESRRNQASKNGVPVAFHVCAKLGPPLANLMGNSGFRALLRRALTLAQASHSSLGTVQVNADGSLGTHGDPAVPADAEEAARGGVALLTQLLTLLASFIGESLTLRLVRETWPRLPPKDSDSGNQAKP